MPKIKTNKWIPAGEAISMALNSREYGCHDGDSNSPYMCDAVTNVSCTVQQREAYSELWEAISHGTHWGLLEVLAVEGVLAHSMHVKVNYGTCRKYRFKVGRIFWRAVSEYILAGKRNITGIRNAGYNAIREALRQGKL